MGVWKVLIYQNVPWHRLSNRGRGDAEKHLEISREVWNGQLAAFNNELWGKDGISLSHDEEFQTVLKALDKLYPAGRILLIFYFSLVKYSP